MAYRETFIAYSHGDALKAMYAKFQVAFGVPRTVLHAEVMADRKTRPALYRKLQRELTSRTSVKKAVEDQRPLFSSGKNAPKVPEHEQQHRDVQRPRPTRCPKCSRKLASANVRHYGRRGRLCSGSITGDSLSAPIKPPPMAVTLAKWNIDLEPEYQRPPGQRIHQLIVNFDTGKWQTTGVLGAIGYHVGRNGLDKRTRRAILAEAVQVKLVAASAEYAEYVSGWGAPNSKQRLVKIRDSISAFAKIRRTTRADYSAALADWDSDLDWLRATYQMCELPPHRRLNYFHSWRRPYGLAAPAGAQLRATRADQAYP